MNLSQREFLAFFVVAFFASFGCQKESRFISIDDEPIVPSEAVAPLVVASSEAPVATSDAPETSPKRDPINPNGATLDLTEVADFDGATTEELANWSAVKVVRGRGLLTKNALASFAKLEQLTEFLWSDASIRDDSASEFAALVKAPKLKRVRLTGLSLEGSGEFPASTLGALATSKTLVDLDLSGSPLGAGELNSVSSDGFPALVKLNLYQTRVGDAGVDALLPLADRLTSLNLDDAGITSASAAKIASFSNLTFLHVGRSQLDDDAIMEFAKLSKLEKIHITRSNATEDGANRLRQALPNCEVVSQVAE